VSVPVSDKTLHMISEASSADVRVRVSRSMARELLAARERIAELEGEPVDRFEIQWEALVEADPDTLSPGALDLRARMLAVSGLDRARERIAELERERGGTHPLACAECGVLTWWDRPTGGITVLCGACTTRGIEEDLDRARERIAELEGTLIRTVEEEAEIRKVATDAAIRERDRARAVVEAAREEREDGDGSRSCRICGANRHPSHVRWHREDCALAEYDRGES